MLAFGDMMGGGRLVLLDTPPASASLCLVFVFAGCVLW